ncbi:selenide, water dikinase [Ditylenchus destructor]|nr:selenide, water dikinase [Ditylenchus destructor]
MSAALKKGKLDDAAYRRMIATTTQLNTAGPDLAALEGVHALTDVTGFGLAGHALEIARGSGCTVEIDWSSVPLLEGVALAAGLPAETQALLSDPQTSGGLLVSCASEAVDEVLGVFARHGFAAASVVGRVVPAADSALRVG